MCSKCEFGVQVLNVFFKSLIDYKSGQTKLSNREWINKLLELCDTDI